jgi:hypothetical protein
MCRGGLHCNKCNKEEVVAQMEFRTRVGWGRHRLRGAGVAITCSTCLLIEGEGTQSCQRTEEEEKEEMQRQVRHEQPHRQRDCRRRGECWVRPQTSQMSRLGRGASDGRRKNGMEEGMGTYRGERAGSGRAERLQQLLQG